MSTFYFVRHGDTGIRDRIAGRSAGIHLNDTGRRQAQETAERFAGIPVAAVYSSPLERAIETAEAIAAVVGRPLLIASDLSEVDYGEWTGLSFDALKNDLRWQHFNSNRASATIPGGEQSLTMQRRMVQWTEHIRRQHATERVVAVSHQDPIKAVMMQYLGMHLDLYYRFDIAFASVSVVRVENDFSSVLTLNNVAALPE